MFGIDALRSVRSKFLAMVVPPVVLCFLLFSFLMGLFTYQDITHEMMTGVEDFTEVQSVALARPLWELNYELIERDRKSTRLNSSHYS